MTKKVGLVAPLVYLVLLRDIFLYYLRRKIGEIITKYLSIHQGPVVDNVRKFLNNNYYACVSAYSTLCFFFLFLSPNRTRQV